MGNFCDAFSSVCVRTKSSPKKSLTASDISKSICKIYISDQKITGFLLKLPKQGNNSFYLLTNNHLITDEMLNKKQEIKLYYDDNDSKNVSINLDQNERYIRNFKEKLQIDENFKLAKNVYDILKNNYDSIKIIKDLSKNGTTYNRSLYDTEVFIFEDCKFSGTSNNIELDTANEGRQSFSYDFIYKRFLIDEIERTKES